MVLPLEGLTVLDFSTLLPGPLAGLILAEAGAEVIKVERPEGEDMRGFPPMSGGTSGGMPAAFASLNGGKRFLALDLKDPDAAERLRPLIARADIVIEQFRPGVMDRLGLGYAALREIRPDVIYCSITGYGQTGPRAAEPGHDMNYQALAGLLSQSPGTPEAPCVPAALTADIAGGAFPAVLNILLALQRRHRTGEGCHLDIAMADGVFTFAWYGLAEGHATGRFPGAGENFLAGGSPRYRLYATADGGFVAVGALEEKFWRTFCAAIDLPEALRDDSHDPAGTRSAVAAILGSQDQGTWRERLEPLQCCCTVVRSLEEARRDPHFAARGLFDAMSSDGLGAEVPLAPLPIAPVLRRAPDEARVVGIPGADNHRIL